MRTLPSIIIAACLLGTAANAEEMGHGDDPAPTIFKNIRTELDYAPTSDGLFDWDVDGWVGGDSERIWLRSEGEVEDGVTRDAEAQIYYGWNVDPFWDVLVGVRQDFEPDRRRISRRASSGSPSTTSRPKAVCSSLTAAISRRASIRVSTFFSRSA